MKRIILFRFHRDPAVCKNRIQLLRLFNLGMKIYGLYGGPEKKFPEIHKKLGNVLENIYCIQGKSTNWKWKNSDLAVRLWYVDYGKDLSFDMLYIIEWDMLVFGSIPRIYKHIPENGVGLSGLIPLKKRNQNWIWVFKEPYKSEWAKLFSMVKDNFKYDMEPFACIAGGACFPKKFIEKYSRIDIPELCNDEVRIPLFAQILGFKIFDTGFFNRHDKDAVKYFNLTQCIYTQTIRNELCRPEGRRVFHPYCKVFCQMVDCNGAYNIWYTIKAKSINYIRTILGQKIYKVTKNSLRKSFKY